MGSKVVESGVTGTMVDGWSILKKSQPPWSDFAFALATSLPAAAGGQELVMRS
jgi:hypothetical protein